MCFGLWVNDVSRVDAYLFTQVFLVAQNSGLGMFPALKDGDLMVVFRLQRDYAKNDVVTYRAEGRRYVGRIAAAAGDEVDMDEDGNLTVNGALQTGEILYPTYAGEDGPAAARAHLERYFARRLSEKGEL